MKRVYQAPGKFLGALGLAGAAVGGFIGYTAWQQEDNYAASHPHSTLTGEIKLVCVAVIVVAAALLLLGLAFYYLVQGVEAEHEDRHAADDRHWHDHHAPANDD